MKNLFLLPILITNPLQTTTIGQQNEELITNCVLTQDNATNCANTYTKTTNPQDEQTGPYLYANYEITQKLSDKAPQNNYGNFEIYNYCGLQYDMYQDDSDYLYYNTFVIIAYTPYNNINSSQISLRINLNNNMSDLSQQYINTQYNLNYITATTTTDLGNLLNTSNWTNINKSKRDDNNAQNNTYWETAYTFNLQKNTIAQFNDEIDPLNAQDIYSTTISNINLQSKKTTYIIMQIQLDMTINSANPSLLKNIYDPNENTMLLYTRNIEIISGINETTYTQEIIDIPNLMFTILGLPFTFISQAFNLTIFPGTPYQVNFSNIFLGFIAIALLLWVLKLILGRADIGQWLHDSRIEHDNRRNEMRRHKAQMKTNEIKHNNLVSEQRYNESNRHVRQTHKDGKQ